MTLRLLASKSLEAKTSRCERRSRGHLSKDSVPRQCGPEFLSFLFSIDDFNLRQIHTIKGNYASPEKAIGATPQAYQGVRISFSPPKKRCLLTEKDGDANVGGQKAIDVPIPMDEDLVTREDDNEG